MNDSVVDPAILERVFAQSPLTSSKDEVISCLVANKMNEVETLCALWKVERPSTKERDDTQKKWDEIREICNSYEEAVQKAMENSRDIRKSPTS